MSLKNININSIGKVLEMVLKSEILFSEYTLNSENIQESTSPTKFTQYDFQFISEKYDRWLFIRIKDFFSHQEIVILINYLKFKKSININVKEYFISMLNKKNVKQKMIFKSNSEEELFSKLKPLFDFLVNNLDDNLRRVILGEKWIDMPMDWGEYK